jgi:hypothetical protein
MYLGDNGGAMALQLQLLSPTKEGQFTNWEKLFPRFYWNIEKIPTEKFHVVHTGEPIIKK